MPVAQKHRRRQRQNLLRRKLEEERLDMIDKFQEGEERLDIIESKRLRRFN